MKTKLLTLALLAAGLAGPALPLSAAERSAPVSVAAVNTPDPAQQVRDLARLFRAGDVAGMARTMMPASKWEEVRLLWELKRQEPISEKDRAEFAEHIAKITAPGAIDEIMAEIEPKFDEARPQAPGALLMAFGAAQMAINSPESKLTDEQRAALQSVLPGFQQWASSTDFLDAATARDAVTLMVDAARRTGITSLDQLRALPLEGVLDRARPVLAAAKDAVQLYGLDINAIADSLVVDVLDNDGQTARVRTTVTLFGAPVWHEHELVLVEGRWYGKHALEHWRHGHGKRVHGDEVELEIEVDG
jgi:hypothetical protein